MATIRVGGWDPSLSNFGMVKGDLDLDTGLFEPIELKLVTTSATKNKTTRTNSDDLRRSRELFKGVHEFFTDVELVFVELPVGSQSSRAQTSYGVCIGVAASIKAPLIECTASQLKLAVTNNKTASKAAMIQAMTTLYPELNWLTKKSKGVVSYTDANEHLADALAAIHAGVQTEQFKELLIVFKSIGN